MTRVLTWTAGAVVTALCAVAAALWLGGPRSIAPLASINAPFAKVDFSTLPTPRHYTARDGTPLAYRRYAPAAAAAAPTHVVLLHGSSADSRSMHPLAQALAAAGFAVDALDMRGHGASGQRGHIAYVGQLEDDLQDFLGAVPTAPRRVLVGLSAGGGFALRFAADGRASLFDRYVLLSPFVGQDAPTARPGLDGWVSVGIARIVALSLLNGLGVTAFNHLPVTEFALDEKAREFLTSSYDFNLATNYRPRRDWAADLHAVRQPMRVVVGQDDELFRPEQFAPVFASAGVPVPVTVVPGANHIGVSLAPAALGAVVAACQ